MYRTELIQAVIDRKKAKSYMEIGVCGGKNFYQVKCDRKVGVDPIPPDKKWVLPLLQKMGDKHHYYQMTSDEFFDGNADAEHFDVVFIDGLHTKEQAWVDFHNAMGVLKENGVIIMHDCNPTDKAMQVVPQKQKRWTGDVWKAWVVIRTMCHDADIAKTLCMQDDYGLGVVFIDGFVSPLDIDWLIIDECNTAMRELTYDYMDGMRNNLLGLVDEKKFLEALKVI